MATRLTLPIDVLYGVAEQLAATDNAATLASLARCSRETYDMFNPILHRHVILTKNNVVTFFNGFDLPSSSARTRLSPTTETDITRWPGVALSHEQDDPPYALPVGTAASHARKLRSFRSVRSLTIAVCPPASLAESLAALHDPESQLFPRLETLTFEAPLVSFLTDWLNRHTVRFQECGTLVHPFVEFLRAATDPKQFCVSLPTLRAKEKEVWYLQRGAGPQNSARRARLRAAWDAHRNGSPGMTLLPLLWAWSRIDMMTVHNVTSSFVPLPQTGTLRIVFAPCECYRCPVPMEPHCGDHIDAPARARRIARAFSSAAKRVEGHNELDRLELVHVGRLDREGQDKQLEKEVTWMLEEDLSAEDWRKVSFKTRGDGGEVCECCASG